LLLKILARRFLLKEAAIEFFNSNAMLHK